MSWKCMVPQFMCDWMALSGILMTLVMVSIFACCAAVRWAAGLSSARHSFTRRATSAWRILASAGRPRLSAYCGSLGRGWLPHRYWRSEEHTSELQSHLNLVCRLLLEIGKAHV